MEWALELINGYKKGEARATNVVRNSRNIVVPIVNADGFEASRTAGAIAGQDGGRDESVDDTAYLVAGATTGGEYRRKNCRLPDDSAAGNCTTSVGLAENGVDPNRNYGGLWGGPGADTNPLTQSYRGPGPFSEPETRNVKSVVSRHQVMTLITNHTTAGARAARARPGDARRPGRREPRLQGARRRDGQGERLLLPEVVRALRHDRHDRGLELQRHGRLRLHLRALLRRAQLRDGRLRRPGLPPALPARGRGVGRHQPDGRPHQRPGPEQGLRRQGQPRGVLHRRRERDQREAPQRARRAASRRAPRCA